MKEAHEPLNHSVSKNAEIFLAKRPLGLSIVHMWNAKYSPAVLDDRVYVYKAGVCDAPFDS